MPNLNAKCNPISLAQTTHKTDFAINLRTTRIYSAKYLLRYQLEEKPLRTLLKNYHRSHAANLPGKSKTYAQNSISQYNQPIHKPPSSITDVIISFRNCCVHIAKYQRHLRQINSRLTDFSAHNEAGSKILAEWAAKGDSKLLYAIIGVTRGKDRRAFLSNLKPHIKHMYGVCVRSEIHAETSSGITEIAESVGIPAQSSESVKHAVIDICSRYRSPARIIICGSLYLAGDVKKINEGEILGYL